MSKVKIPLTEVEISGSLQSWYYNNAILRSDVMKSTDSTYAYASDSFQLTISEVGNILNAGGEVEEYLMAVKAPIAIMNTDVPSTLPKYQKLDNTGSLVAKKFSDWLVPNAEIWKKDDDTEVIFYTNPFAGNVSSYLKGSEIKVINDLGATVNIMTVADAQSEVASGWTKLNI